MTVTGNTIDIIMFTVLLGLLAGILWFIKLLNNTDQTKINKYCKQGPSFTVKAGSISDQIPDKYKFLVKYDTGVIPPSDLPINFKFNC
jgi:hypothetical protein